MSISRETFDPTKNYKRIRYHQDRDLLDSELNEQQDIINLERRKIADILFKEGSIIMGLEVSAAGGVLTLARVTAGTRPRRPQPAPVRRRAPGSGPSRQPGRWWLLRGGSHRECGGRRPGRSR